MGTDIHCIVEVQQDDGSWKRSDLEAFDDIDWNDKKSPMAAPFNNRCYSLFGWLADVRGYSGVTPLDKPRGLPPDTSAKPDWDLTDQEYDADVPGVGDHSFSWFTAAELLAVDYDQVVEDRRVSRTTVLPNGSMITDGGCTAEPGDGERKTLREFIGDYNYQNIMRLRHFSNPEKVRVVFGFDS